VSDAAVQEAAAAEASESAAALLDRLSPAYAKALAAYSFEEADMCSPSGAYEHHYRQNIADSPQEATAKAKLKRLLQELGRLSEPGNLPLSCESSILVLRDETRMDVLKVLIAGPADTRDPAHETPYAFGLFEFHVFIPADYPHVPPLVNLQTTGDGMVRFNPNLYSDGKVCLSLLGTWHGEGWIAPSAGNAGSTILQVLVSIQSMIMVSKPYFNEPGYAEEENTAAGEQRSKEYSDNVRLHNMRHAMRDQLRRPPIGFEDAVRDHFRHVRPLLLRMCARWLAEAGPTVKAPMERCYTELRALLDPLEAPDVASSGSGGSASAGAAE